jgi:hypothetical protein
MSNFNFETIKWHYISTTEISSRMLNASMPFIISPLTYICNQSLSQGIFPDRLKFAVVKPIFKNCDKCEPSNYRSISLLPTFF